MNALFAGYLKALAQTEWGTREQLVRYQQQLLAQLVRHAYEQVPFYRERLACLFWSSGDVDLSRWREVPILTRAEAALHAAEMRPPTLPKTYGVITELHTSGSTNAPLSIASNNLVWIAANAAVTRMARWWRADTSLPLARIAIFPNREIPSGPQGADHKGWSLANPEADVHELDLLTPVEQQLAWLLSKKAPYLMTSSSNVAALAYAATPEQARALAIELVFGIAETVLPRHREIVAERFGAMIAGIYSCQEVGVLATECAQEPCYHVVAENALVEILSPDGFPVRPGETGQVVITGLYNFAMPFIRYAIGDVATAGPDFCACGRSLPVIARVDGRTRHAFIFRDGSRVWPRLWTLQVENFVSCREFQLVQLDRERIEFRYVPDGSGRPPDHAGLGAYLREMLHPSVVVSIVAMDTIPRGRGGKFDPFLSRVIE
jgi:phenylacetate-coenzyme A ligase PaaK-like adenylate-forming protein